MNFLDKIIKIEKKAVSKIVNNSSYLKVMSLVVAVFLFILINGTGIEEFDKFFTTTKYVDEIPLNVIVNDSKIVTGLPETIGANVSGNSSEITNFERNKKNLSATINLTGHQDGSYDIKKDEIVFNDLYSLKIEPLVETYTVNIDTKDEMTMPVDIGYINQNDAQGVVLGEAKLKSPTITFEIGRKQMEDVASVRVLLNLDKLKDSKDETYVFNETIKIYDNAGNLLDTHTTLPTVEIEQPFEVRTIKLPVKYNDINNNSGKYISSVCKNKITKNCVDEVEVYGNQEKLEKLQYITYDVDMTDYNEEKPIVDAVPILDEGIYIKGESKYKVEVATEEGTTKALESVPIVIQNLDSTLEVPSLKDGTVDVSVTGAKSKVDQMTSSQILVYVDAKGITTEQTVSVPIQSNVDQTIDYSLSKTEIEITFKEKK